MKQATSDNPMPARIESLKVQNFRALRMLDISGLTPLTVLVGPNGSGKSTVLDVFAFLAECFESGLRRAWDRRGRAREIKTHGAEGAVTIELKYRERPETPLIAYHLAVDELDGAPTVVDEWLSWKRGSYGAPFHVLKYRKGKGQAISGDAREADGSRVSFPLRSPDLLAVNTLCQFKEHPRVAALRDFIMDWHVSVFSAEAVRTQPEEGPQERLSKTGDNLANVILRLGEKRPTLLRQIIDRLKVYVPHIEHVSADTMPDGRLSLQIKDAPFSQSVPARFASDGTLKMLACLTLLYDPKVPSFVGLEEPENHLHPRFLYGLAEECRKAAEATQIFVATHSPFFLDALRAREVRVLWRDVFGYTQCYPLDRSVKVRAFLDAGAVLGDLWMEGHLDVGDSPTGHGMPGESRTGI